jgi:hypothetical protein
VSQDFVKTILKIPGGSGDQMTSFLKKLGLANLDGSPNDLYRRFRNPTSSGAAVATAIRRAYAPLYVRNEYVHRLDDSDLLGLVVEETGEAHDSNAVRLIVSCFKHLRSFADFEGVPETELRDVASSASISQIPPEIPSAPRARERSSVGLNLGYTINLNLPATSDAAVFDAIFKSLKQNLLTEDDA